MADPSSSRAPRTERGLDRLVNFSDATVAIAITLLVIPLVDLASEARGHSIVDLLRENYGALLAFAISFAVIGRFWMVHHRLFEHAISYNSRLINVNFVWLASIVFLPFPSNIISGGPGDPVNSAIYIGTMIVTSATAGVLDWLLIHDPGLGNPDTIGELDLAPAVIFSGLLLAALVVAVLFPSINLAALLLLLLRPPIGALWERHLARRAAASPKDSA